MNLIDNKEEGQFEFHIDGQIATITYEIEGREIYLFSTKVPGSLAGKGIGSKLVGETVNMIEKMNLKVIPRCSFVQGWFIKHPEKRHLLA